jgi:hypothetical protein
VLTPCASVRHRGGTLAGMDLEEHTLETVEERCEECGAKLTAREQQLALERGGPNLCTVHAAEYVPLGDDETGEQAAV